MECIIHAMLQKLSGLPFERWWLIFHFSSCCFQVSPEIHFIALQYLLPTQYIPRLIPKSRQLAVLINHMLSPSSYLWSTKRSNHCLFPSLLLHLLENLPCVRKAIVNVDTALHTELWSTYLHVEVMTMTHVTKPSIFANSRLVFDNPRHLKDIECIRRDNFDNPAGTAWCMSTHFRGRNLRYKLVRDGAFRRRLPMSLVLGTRQRIWRPSGNGSLGGRAFGTRTSGNRGLRKKSRAGTCLVTAREMTDRRAAYPSLAQLMGYRSISFVEILFDSLVVNVRRLTFHWPWSTLTKSRRHDRRFWVNEVFWIS
jgi:hypothetical protein